MKQLLTNKEGEVKELAADDFKSMRSMQEVLATELYETFLPFVR